MYYAHKIIDMFDSNYWRQARQGLRGSTLSGFCNPFEFDKDIEGYVKGLLSSQLGQTDEEIIGILRELLVENKRSLTKRAFTELIGKQESFEKLKTIYLIYSSMTGWKQNSKKDVQEQYLLVRSGAALAGRNGGLSAIEFFKQGKGNRSGVCIDMANFFAAALLASGSFTTNEIHLVKIDREDIQREGNSHIVPSINIYEDNMLMIDILKGLAFDTSPASADGLGRKIAKGEALSLLSLEQASFEYYIQYGLTKFNNIIVEKKAIPKKFARKYKKALGLIFAEHDQEHYKLKFNLQDVDSLDDVLTGDKYNIKEKHYFNILKPILIEAREIVLSALLTYATSAYVNSTTKQEAAYAVAYLQTELGNYSTALNYLKDADQKYYQVQVLYEDIQAKIDKQKEEIRKLNKKYKGLYKGKNYKSVVQRLSRELKKRPWLRKYPYIYYEIAKAWDEDDRDTQEALENYLKAIEIYQINKLTVYEQDVFGPQGSLTKELIQGGFVNIIEGKIVILKRKLAKL